MQKIKVGRDRCDKCGRECNDSAGVEVRGQVKFYCYTCYKDYKKQRGE